MDDLMDKKTLEKLHTYEVEILDEFVRICNNHNLSYFLYGGTLLGAIRHKGFIPWDDDLDVAMPRKDYELFLEIAQSEIKGKYEIDNYHTNKLCYLNFTKIRNKETLFIQDFQGNHYKGPKGIWIDIFPLDNVKYEDSFLQGLRIKTIKTIRAIAHYKSKIYLGRARTLKKVIGIIFGILPLNSLMRFQDKLMKFLQNSDTEYFVGIASQYNYKKQTMSKKVFFPAVNVEFEGKLYKAPHDYEAFLTRIYGDYMQLPSEDKRVTHNPVELKFEGEL